MKVIVPCLVMLALAGCTQPGTPAARSVANVSSPDGAAALHLAGVYWLPTTTANAPGSGAIDVPLNGSGLHVEIALKLGTRVAGMEAPSTAANAMVRLVDSTNATLGEAMLMASSLEANIVADHAASGTAHLVFDTHGGSNGSSSGDHVDFTVSASARQA